MTNGENLKIYKTGSSSSSIYKKGDYIYEKLHNNSKGAKFTKGLKWTLAYYKLYGSKAIAMKEEYLLKHDIKKRKKIKNKFLKNEDINITPV